MKLKVIGWLISRLTGMHFNLRKSEKYLLLVPFFQPSLLIRNFHVQLCNTQPSPPDLIMKITLSSKAQHHRTFSCFLNFTFFPHQADLPSSRPRYHLSCQSLM